jgi:KTSC domain-containing protein
LWLGALQPVENAVQLKTVESSMIHAVGYERQTHTLEVVFNSGQTYQYHDVPPEEYAGLMAADSKGSYMRAHIIDMYEYTTLRRRRR